MIQIYSLEEARGLARELQEQLRDMVAECLVAGSIRREKETVKDIELVVLPSLAESFRVSCCRLDRRLLELVETGYMEFDTVTKRAGERYKRFRLRPPRAPIGIDLFLADEQNFGNIAMIRTGSAEYSKAVMSVINRKGLKHREGYLYRGGEVIPCPTEQEFFKAVGLKWVPPRERTPEAAEYLVRAMIRKFVAVIG